MGWGGARVGAGRKPKGERAAVVLGMDGSRLSGTQALPGVTAADALLEPPKDLPREARLYWRRWAPLAIAQRTLVPEKVPGFGELCVLAVVFEKLKTFVMTHEPTHREWGDRHQEYLKTGKDLRTSLQSYMLCAFGKPEPGTSRAKSTSTPWAAIGK